MINVSEVLYDPAFYQKINILIEAGLFTSDGVYHRSITTITTVDGNLQPASQNDILQFYPNGEINSRYVKIHSIQPVMMGEGDGRESYYVWFEGAYYRVTDSKLYEQYGYWFSIAQMTDKIKGTPVNP